MNQPEEFSFPFPPYPIQKELMNRMYETIDKSKIGIFESPTGTGKSLCILCSVLKWIIKNEESENIKFSELNSKVLENNNNVTNGLDWVEAFASKKKVNIEIDKNLDDLKRKKELRNFVNNIKRGRNLDETIVETDNLNLTNKIEIDDFMIDYESDDEEETREESLQDDYGVLKVFYCSRTHSQLNQVIKELRKTVYFDKITITNLASRQSLCINFDVNRLKFINLINEKCLDLQKHSKTSQKGCLYKSQKKIDKLTKEIIKSPLDIEDLVEQGKKLSICPFYSSRNSVKYAQLVLLPYQNLLNPAARIGSKIDVEKNIIIIDEAHNLPDTIMQVNSVELGIEQIQIALEQLEEYLRKYLIRLSQKNLFYIRQLNTILINFLQFLKDVKYSVQNESKNYLSFDCVDFIFRCSLNSFRLDKLLNFLQQSKLAFKLRGFMRSDKKSDEIDGVIVKKRKLFEGEVAKLTNDEERIDRTVNSMLIVTNFLTAIQFSIDSARILVTPMKGFYFLVVDPGKYLRDLVTQCRSIIVLGGTMKPFSDFIQLFQSAGCQPDELELFTCSHIVDAAKQLKIFPISHNQKGQSLKFTYANKSNTEMLKNCGEIIYEALSVCPNGAVVFMPSYEFMRNTMATWKSQGLMDRITSIKRVFIEPKSSNDLDMIMTAYSKVAQSTVGRGGVLFAVIGGKMSEGINFDDELARIVCVVGVPYANLFSAVLQEKRSFIETKYGELAGQLMYENGAMKAVNQAIGRAIRHRSDYSSVLLIDSRYQQIVRNTNTNKLGLPEWMKPGLVMDNVNDLDSLKNQLIEFYDTFK